jgi:primosomal protein N'
MTDTGTCPHCDQAFDVQQYGRRLPCPCCGKSIDVLPEPQLWIDTPIGTIGVAGDLTALFQLAKLI